jgi:hypothetical protein
MDHSWGVIGMIERHDSPAATRVELIEAAGWLTGRIQSVVATLEREELAMGAKRRAADRARRPAMRSPGRPPVGRLEHRQRFWAAIARGLSSEDAAVQAGVSAAVGVRWFREAGGMPSVTLAPASGGTCRLPSGRRSLFCAPAAPASGRSRVSSAARRRRSPESSVVTLRLAAAGSSTGPRPPSGTPTSGRGAPSPRSSP